MLTGKELTKATLPFAKEDEKKSWLYTTITFILLVSTQSFILISENIFIQCFFSVLSGLLTVRSFVIYHDFMHQAILRNSKMAEYFFTLFGIYVLAPKSVWQASHNFHHQNNSKTKYSAIGSYPVYSKTKFNNSSRIKKFDYLFSRHPVTILFGYLFTFFIGMCVKPFLLNFKKHVDSFIAIVFHITIQITLLYMYDLKTVILFSIIPHFLAGAIGSYLFYIQHNFPTTIFKSSDNWTYESAALESSSFLKVSKIIHWFTGNIGYHHIHHLNARIPFYRLPEVMSHFIELQNPKTTSLKPREILKCLKLKVWDHKTNRMTSV